MSFGLKENVLRAKIKVLVPDLFAFTPVVVALDRTAGHGAGRKRHVSTTWNRKPGRKNL